jgi:hypothetical protein
MDPVNDQQGAAEQGTRELRALHDILEDFESDCLHALILDLDCSFDLAQQTLRDISAKADRLELFAAAGWIRARAAWSKITYRPRRHSSAP